MQFASLAQNALRSHLNESVFITVAFKSVSHSSVMLTFVKLQKTVIIYCIVQCQQDAKSQIFYFPQKGGEATITHSMYHLLSF